MRRPVRLGSTTILSSAVRERFASSHREHLLLLAVSLLVGLCAFSMSAAEAAEPPEYVRSFGPDGTEASYFGAGRALAIDQQAHVVYVIDSEADKLYKFGTDGAPLAFTGTAGYIEGNALTGLSFFNSFNESQVAVDQGSHIIYVTSGNGVEAFQANGEQSEFTAGPGTGTNRIAGFGELIGVAVDANGAIYASDYAGAVHVYAPSGEPITEFATEHPGNLAIASGGAVYVNRWGGTVRKFVPSSFPVTGTTAFTADSEPVDPANSSAVAVDPFTDDVYIAETVGQIAKYNAAGTRLEVIGEGTMHPTGVGIDNGSLFVSAQFEPDEKWRVGIFAEPQPQPPVIEALFATSVSSDSAILGALINPELAATTYDIEYGTAPCSAVPDPCTPLPPLDADIGSARTGVRTTRALRDLLPGTTYYFRAKAENSEGTDTAERSFTTQIRAAGFDLADARAWEMVTPSNKHGGLVSPFANGVIQASADGDGLAYMTWGSIEPNPEGNRLIERSAVLARRSPDGWRSKDLTPPHTEAASIGVTPFEYQAFSSDLSRAILVPGDATPLSPYATERTPYLRENSESPLYIPLVTSQEGHANVEPGLEFGGVRGSSEPRVYLRGATSDLSHVVLADRFTSLLPDAGPNGLYEWEDGELHPITTLPAAEGGGPSPGKLGSDQGSVQHAISEDGSRVFWGLGGYSAAGNGMLGLYLRDTETEETVRIDVKQAGGAGTAAPAFQGANQEGTVVFFTDSGQLTADASPTGPDLYRCTIPAADSSQGCTNLIDISAPLAGSGESAKMLGLVSGLSEDGTRAYFVAKGVLDTEPNEAGETAQAGKFNFNLYTWHAGDGVRFVAGLSVADNYDWGRVGDEVGYAGQLSAAVSPSGRYLSFMSQRSLTGYDSRDAVAGEPDQAVFRYDAVKDELDCVSCNPTGAAPRGLVLTSLEAGSRAVDPKGLWNGSHVAATVPEAVNAAGDAFLYPLQRPRSTLDNGRVFFNAVDGLVPADSNGQWDVYEYEPLGVGSCTASSGDSTVVRTAEGCTALLSSGTSVEEAGFFDASATGDDVFFISSSKLSVLDQDEETDIYDARVDGVEATLAGRSECLGEACLTVPQPPNDPTPASAAFKGAGNVVNGCRAGRRRITTREGNARCVVTKQKKHRKKHHRANRGRRAGQ
jgi:hypothetical protein